MTDKELIICAMENIADEFKKRAELFPWAGNEWYQVTIMTAIRMFNRIDETNWVKISPAGVYECSKCGQNVMTGDIKAYKYCHGCGRKVNWDAEPRAGD